MEQRALMYDWRSGSAIIHKIRRPDKNLFTYWFLLGSIVRRGFKNWFRLPWNNVSSYFHIVNIYVFIRLKKKKKKKRKGIETDDKYNACVRCESTVTEPKIFFIFRFFLSAPRPNSHFRMIFRLANDLNGARGC